MIRTATQTGIRLQCVCFQLRAVNAQTVCSPKLDEVINVGVAQEALDRIYLYGMSGYQIMAKLVISIDYQEHHRQVSLAGDVPPGRQNAYSWSPAGAAVTGGPGVCMAGQECPVWREAIDYFVTMVREKGLVLKWAVTFCQRSEEMDQRLGLGPSTVVDCTYGSPSHAFPNTLFSELSATASFSNSIWPE